MIRKKTLVLFILCFLCVSLHATSLFLEGGFSGSVSDSAYGGAKSLALSVGAGTGIGAEVPIGDSTSLILAAFCEGGLNRNVVNATRFAAVPDGYFVEAGLKTGIGVLDKRAMFFLEPSVREVYFQEQDQWLMQVGGRLQISCQVLRHVSLDCKAGLFWNKGFVSAPVDLGFSVML